MQLIGSTAGMHFFLITKHLLLFKSIKNILIDFSSKRSSSLSRITTTYYSLIHRSQYQNSNFNSQATYNNFTASLYKYNKKIKYSGRITKAGGGGLQIQSCHNFLLYHYPNCTQDGRQPFHCRRQRLIGIIPGIVCITGLSSKCLHSPYCGKGCQIELKETFSTRH
jgi:hypothetical protein